MTNTAKQNAADKASGPKRRQRAARAEVLQRYAERRAAAPLHEHLSQWHERAASLAGMGHHRLLRGLSTEAVEEEAKHLVERVVETTEDWRQGLCGMAVTGEMMDAERSGRSVLATLDALLHRLRGR